MNTYDDVHIFRFINNQQRKIIVPLTDTNYKLADRDIIQIYNKNDFIDPQVVFIQGEVNNSGHYQYFSNMTLLGTILLSKLNEFASKINIEVARFKNNTSQVFYVNYDKANQFS